MKADKIKTDKQDTGTSTGKVFAQVERAQGKATPAASPEEAAERRRNMRTKGKKGCELKRITMAFSDPNYEYLYVMSRIEGTSITRFINELIDESREKNADIYEAAKKLTEGRKK